MGKPLLVDTDVLVDFLRGHTKAVAFVEAEATRIILSAVVVAELFAGVREGSERETLEEFVSLFPIIPVSADIGAKGGLYKRDYGDSHGVGLADAILAATAEAENAELKTLNTRHYPMLKRLRPPYRK
jgi:hypothetical protein